MLQLGLYASPPGALLADYSQRAVGLEMTTNEHGFGTLSCFVPMGLHEAFFLYDRPGFPHVELNFAGERIWEGRLEDVAITGRGVRLGAFGYWRALYDAPYTALWSTTRYDEWRPVTAQDITGWGVERYVHDNNNRLYLAPRKNEVFGVGEGIGGLTFVVPHNGERNVQTVTFDYSFTVPSSTWRARLHSYSDTPFGAGTLEWVLGSGSASGSASVTLTSPNARLVFSLLYNAAGTTQYTGETDAAFLRITNLRVRSDTGTADYADEIITKGLIPFVTGINSGQLSSSTALVSSPGIDLKDEVYDDAWPAEIIRYLAGLGDNSTPVKLYEAGVWEGRRLVFQQRGTTARTWYVDITEQELDRTLDVLANSVYAVYHNESGRPLRTAISTDSNSVARYGFTRRKSVPASTSSGSQAAVHRDAALQDGKDPRPRLRIKFKAIFDAAGNRYPLWQVRAWDQIVVRNLPTTLSPVIDRIRVFRASETRYQPDSNELEVTPEGFLPTLDTLIARLAAGLPLSTQTSVVYNVPRPKRRL